MRRRERRRWKTWEGAGGQQQEGEGGDEEKGEEEVEDLGLSGLGQSIHHKLLQSVLIPLVQLVLGLHLLIVHLPLFLIVFLDVASLLLKDHIKHNLNSFVVAEAKIISWNPAILVSFYQRKSATDRFDF